MADGLARSGQERAMRRAGVERSLDGLRRAYGDSDELAAYERAGLTAANHPGSKEARSSMDQAARILLQANSNDPETAAFLNHFDNGGGVAQVGEITVNGSRGYLFGSTIDGAGIWVGEKGNEIAQGVGQFINNHPGIGIALTLADGAFAVVAPAKYLGGMALSYFNDEASGYIADKMTGPQLWSVGKGQAGGSGFVLAGSIALGGLGALRGVAGGARLLPGEGMVGTYDDLIAAGVKGDNITSHHIPSANRMALEGVSKGDGIAINMEQPSPGVGGRHRATFTYGTTADIAMSPRDALAAGVWDARRIYQADGLYTPQIRSSLQDVIRMNKANHPTIFVK